MAYELTKELETGNGIIDSEHKKLFKAVNDFLDACGKGQGRTSMESVINFLTSYVDHHFSHEEQLQKDSKYPGYLPHKAFHDNYKLKLKELVSGVRNVSFRYSEYKRSHWGTCYAY